MRRYVQYMYSYPHKTAYRPLEGVSLEDRAGLLADRENEWYIHLPFCESKCGYCNLFSVAGADPALIEAYLDRVEIQASQYREMFERQEKMPVFSSLTVGGGTPLLLSPAQLQRMFSIVKRTAPMTEKPEIIVETAPNQTTEEKLALLRENGVTRVSIGVQSFLDSELLTMGRRHRAAQAEKALELMKQTGFDCVNLDLIYGVPGQTKESFLFSVAKAVSFEPQELFLYPLYVRKGVSMAEGIADEEQAYSLYCEAVSFLKARGYRRDSMRRFVRSDRPMSFRECGYGNTLSLGCGGRSYLGNLHACAPFAVRPSQSGISGYRGLSGGSLWDCAFRGRGKEALQRKTSAVWTGDFPGRLPKQIWNGARSRFSFFETMERAGPCVRGGEDTGDGRTGPASWADRGGNRVVGRPGA